MSRPAPAVLSHRRSLRAAARLPAYSDARRDLIRLADLALSIELGRPVLRPVPRRPGLR